MANITRIKAGSGGKSPDKPPKKDKKQPEKLKNAVETPKKATTKPVESSTKKAPKDTVPSKKAVKTEKTGKKSHTPKLILFITAPFRAIGRYLRDSWRELRQVRWTNRKATWKIVFAVFVYTGLFMAIIMLLDIFFTFIFNLILGK